MVIKNLFKKALTKMVEDKEFDKMIAYTNIKTEKKEIETYKTALEEYGAENLPIIPLIMNANAPILKDVLCYMIDLEENE